jgi:uncharacterized protein YrrD
MRIDLKAKIKTADGHEAGNIRRVLIDPATEKVTGFVVSTGRLLGHEVIIGEDALSGATGSGDAITLTLTKEELDTQPTFEETDYVLPPSGWSAPTLGYAVPPDAFLLPVTAMPPETRDEPGRPAIKKGDTVKDRDGDVVGVVEEIRLNESTGDLVSFIVKAGAGLERLFGTGKVAEVSRDDVLRIVDGEVRIGLDKEEIVPREHETGTR